MAPKYALYFSTQLDIRRIASCFIEKSARVRESWAGQMFIVRMLAAAGLFEARTLCMGYQPRSHGSSLIMTDPLL